MSVAPINNNEESKPVVHMSGVHHGNIVSNRKLMPPVIDPSMIEKEAYIPMEFAQSKMEEVTNDLNLLKTGYDHYISKMKVFYDNQNKETKSHYETYILDLKKKALKHLELERAKAKKREETLQTALQKKEEEMEDLRDMNAERISDLQNKMLLVKKQHQTELSDRQQCDLTLKRMLMIIENEGVKDISNKLVEKLSKQKNDEVSVIKNDHTQIIKKIEDDKKQHEKKVAKEKKELKLQERDRAKKQLARSTACEESKVFMSDLLQQLQLKKQELLLNKERRKLDSLQRSKGDYEKSIAEMKDQMEAEREKSAAAIKKYGKKCKSLQNEKESLLAEKEALVAENQATGRRHEKEHQRNQRADIESALHTIVSEVEMRSRIDNELAHERKKINELNNVIDGLKKEIFEAESRAPLRKDGVNQADTKGQPLPVTSTYSEAQKSADVSELEKLREKLADLQYDVEVDEEELTDTVKEKADTKAVIKDWMKKFEAENGRPPNNEEKSSVRDMFVAHKTATKKVEAVTSAIEAKKGEINTLRDQIAALEKKIADAELSMTPTVVGGGSVPDEVVQGYKQRISELEASNSELNKTAQAAELDKNSALALIETLKAEKRTDVIVRYEKEIEELKRNIHDLETSVASSKTERTKLESRVTELSDRATKAEEELKEQEDRAAKNMGHSEEIQQLQEKIVKQRAEIVSKSKAATAGWDEAAETMEKFDLAVKQSYQKGIAEGKQNSKAELDALTAEIEAKENRISDLLEAVSAADQKAAQAAVELEEAIKNANIAIEEAATGRQNERGGSDSDSDDDAENGGYASKELQAELDAAQEEITTLCSQVDSLQNALHLSNEKCDVLEKLLAQSSSNATVKSDASVEGLVQKVKQTTEEGTKLWKDNKKDECCDLYETVSNEIAGANCPQQLRDAVTSALDSAKGQSKRRAAVILRKGLDNFVAEADKIHPTTTAAPISDNNNSDHDALLHKLKAIQKKSDEQKSESKQGTGDESGGGNAALVRRAKAAEEKVKSLQKELAAAKKATPKGKPSAAGGKGSADDAKEIRNLNKQIKELEKQLNAGGGGGGGGGNAAKDKIALANQEKKFKKEIKEMETANRKEKASLEKELGGVKGELEKVTASCNAATEERDKLRKRVEELGNANSEMEALRAKAELAEELQAQIKAMKKEIADLTAQYKKESNLRKKYKNELEDLKGAIRVYARVRPFAKYEIERGCESVVRFPDETSVTVQTSRGEKEFEFDAAFRDDTSQEEVFEDTKRLVESMIDGYNVCLFAYGQTGSGKTFTMTGSADMPGLTPRAIGEMFRLISEKKNCTARVSTYFVELYNDAVVDLYWLLDNGKNKRAEPPKLDIKVDAKKMVFIKNAVIKSVENSDELLELFRRGNLERHVGATKMNAESSRSHSIFAVMCESYDATTKKTTVGKLSLVDLAGSERADKTGAGAERLREAQSINKSLSALGDVISALSEGEKFIPYRNNKLTQLMQDSLGGNAKTLMFVNFSPADYNCDETVTSLSYATRVKKITNNAAKQAESEEVARLKALIKKLQAGQTIDEGDDGQEETKGS